MSRHVFHNLEGRWSIERDIVGIGTGRGVVTFSKAKPNVLHYLENIDLKFSDNREYHNAHQKYKFIYDDIKGVIAKYTSSDDLMYELNIENNIAGGVYLCNLDKYIATYQFLDDEHFTLTYTVFGPKKNFTIITSFERIDESETIGEVWESEGED